MWLYLTNATILNDVIVPKWFVVIYMIFHFKDEKLFLHFDKLYQEKNDTRTICHSFKEMTL